jgi:hypothetical protein
MTNLDRRVTWCMSDPKLLVLRESAGVAHIHDVDVVDRAGRDSLRIGKLPVAGYDVVRL